ncbi:MAG: hypothetical protein LAO78_13030 [Acidobacteriia bacterium]|nr:hypothetical protein [Terriglobia bacterium]
MAVVINDMEVSPQPAGAGAQQAQGGGDSGSRDKMKQIEKDLRKKHQRKHRLEAY